MAGADVLKRVAALHFIKSRIKMQAFIPARKLAFEFKPGIFLMNFSNFFRSHLTQVEFLTFNRIPGIVKRFIYINLNATQILADQALEADKIDANHVGHIKTGDL